MSGNINITVYNSKAAQEAAERAELAATKAENIKILYLKNEIPAPAGLILPTLDPIGNPVLDGTFMEVNKGSYTNVDSTPLPVLKDKGRLYFNQTKWQVALEWDLPTQEGVNELNPEGESLPKEKAVAKFVAPLSAILKGGDVLFGDSDLSGYTTNNAQEYLFLHRAFPINVKGEFVEANIVFHRGGAYNVYIARPVIGQPQRFTMLGKTAKTAVIGINLITSDIEVLPGDLIAIGQIAGGALVKTKDGANGLWTNITSSNADVANGTEIAFSGSNRIMALNYKIKVESIQNKVETVESEVIFSMKEDKLKYRPSTNLFDPSKLVTDRYVNSSGGITSPTDPTPEEDADDWKMLFIDISDIPAGTKINWGAINVTKPGYIAFYNKPQYIPGDSIQLVEGTMDAPELVNFTNSSGSTIIPPNSKGFAINAKRASDTDSVFERAMINIGPELLPYEPFSVGTIIEYNGIPFEGSKPNGEFKTDQNTRTTDNVAFFKLTVEELEANVIVANIPEWDEMSSNNILKDQAYKVSDGNGNFIIKAKGGV